MVDEAKARGVPGEFRCPHCGVAGDAHDGLCRNCGGWSRSQATPRAPATYNRDESFAYGYTVDHPSDLRDFPMVSGIWLTIALGAALVVGSVLLFSIAIGLLGALGAWFAGIGMFVLGAIGLATFFGSERHKPA